MCWSTRTRAGNMWHSGLHAEQTPCPKKVSCSVWLWTDMMQINKKQLIPLTLTQSLRRRFLHTFLHYKMTNKHSPELPNSIYPRHGGGWYHQGYLFVPLVWTLCFSDHHCAPSIAMYCTFFFLKTNILAYTFSGKIHTIKLQRMQT